MTSIGAWAFEGCSSLTEVVIPEGVTSIGEDAFYTAYTAREFTIYGYENSYAQQYANENDIPFEILKEDNELPVIPPTTNPFTDVSDSMYYYKPVLWALENNVTAGTDSTHFSPEDFCTRGQVVTFLYRALNEK